MRSSKKSSLAFAAVILLFLVYAGFFIYRTSVFMDGERYFVLFDDAMISMQYAKNFANGQGLVWNAGGERVEGFTNPLWVLYMAFFHLLPVPLSKMSLIIQASGAIFLVLNLVYVKKITAELAGSSWLALLAVVLTAFYYPLNNWSLQGMEVSILTLLLSAVVWIVIRSLKSKSFSIWPYLLLGAGTLVRIDMAAPYLAVLGFLLVADRAHRKNHLLWGVVVLAVFLFSQTAFRFWYYGDLLPNTYYLKMTGYPFVARIFRGLYVFFKFLWNFNWILFFLPFAILLFRRDKAILLLLTLVLVQLAYSVYVGGDAWEHLGGSNRYITLAIPLFFILFVLAADRIRQALARVIGSQKFGSGRIDLLSNLALTAFLLISLINVNTLLDTNSLRKLFLIEEINRSNARYVRIAMILNTLTTNQARVAVVTAGAIPYFTDRFSIDLLGKNDPRIAMDESAISNRLLDIAQFRPGHTKWDYGYSIGELQPDVIAQWWEGFDEAQPYLEGRYTRMEFYGIAMYLKDGSPHILWERVASLP